MSSTARITGFGLAAAILAGGAQAIVQAHFKLLEPATWIVENNLGDPQKIAPCGYAPPAPARGGGGGGAAPAAAGNAAAPAGGRGAGGAAPAAAAAAPAAPAVVLTNAVSKVVGGSKLHLKIQETIFHPGHYRVALSVNSRTELPADPYTSERTTERGPQSVWATIQSPPQIPVIADGLFQHYDRPAAPAGAAAGGRGGLGPQLDWETDIQLPNITCTKCTLQVLQFMAEHAYNQPGGYSYHHCADLAITADPAKPIDARWPVQK